MKIICKMIITFIILSSTLLNTQAYNLEIKDINPSGFYKDKDMLYIVDDYTNKIYQYYQDELTFIAGHENIIFNVPRGGLINGLAKYSLFNEPFMAVPWNGGIVVSDTNNHMLRYIKDGITSTYAGSLTPGYVDKDLDSSLFYLPKGLAIDNDGNLLVADTGNGVIRKITKDGTVSTYIDGLQAPVGLCWSENALYITDVVSNQIFKFESDQLKVVSGIANEINGEWIAGFDDGSLNEATFNCPEGIYVENDIIYVADTGNGAIRRIYDNTVETIYQSDLLVMPTGIVIYEGKMIIGDSFSKKYITLNSDEFLPKKEVEQDENSESQLPTTQRVDENNSNALFIGIISGICLVLIGVFLVKKFRKKQDNI